MTGAGRNARSNPAGLVTVTPLSLAGNVNAPRVDLCGAPGSALRISFGGAVVEDLSAVLERQLAQLREARAAVGPDRKTGLLLGKAGRQANREKDDQVW